MTNFEVIIGIENHVELKSNTKIFSHAPVNFGLEHNTQVSEVDLGYPGALPSVNKECVRLALLACNALNLKIDPLLRFDRKNYFYPDLVKGFQITQQFFPIGKDGFLEIELDNNSSKKIEIERLHIEEDTAKQTHKDNLTFIDYNRSGIGLIEIVTKPVIRSSDEAVAYVNGLREILLFLGVSDVKMNEGSLRCDVNISLRPFGYDGYGSKVEVKNLNSLNNVKKAIEFEVKRQSDLLLNGQKIQQETRRFDESKQETVLMRVKNDAVDYKYTREPNIFPIKLNEQWINETIINAPELPSIKRKRYFDDYKLSMDDINYILSDLNLTLFFEETISYGADPKKVANLLITEIKAILNKDNITLKGSNLKPKDLFEIISLTDNGVISSKHVKMIMPVKIKSNENVLSIIEKNNWKLISDTDEIKRLVMPIVQKNTSLIKEQFINRPERVEKTIMGELMKCTGGNVNPDIAINIIKELAEAAFKNQ